MKKLFSIIALFFLFSLCVHIGRALADVAANAQIVNQATLSFDDGSGLQTVNASVTVTVALVPGAPTLDAPADGVIAYAGADTPLAFVYTIIAGGNGPDTYTIAGPILSQTNNGNSASVTVPLPFDLGATITTGGSSATVLQVPSDGNNSDSAVNGIAVDDMVVVNGEARQVAAISDSATGTATITLSAALTSAPGVGVSVLEQRTFTLIVNSGTIVASGTDIVVTVETHASSSAAGFVADEVIATYTSGSATLTKFVRNVDNPNGTTGARSFTVNLSANDYYTDGVTGAPGDTLEYLLLAENTGAGDVTDCTIDDVLPTAFVTLVADAFGGTNEVVYVDGAGAETQLSQESDADAAVIVGASLSVNVGSGAAAASGGTVAGGESVFIVYQVTIN
ncbi:hypothetical protein [uncultured Desulfosarcina sp.]|uniref:hypothetical protein n=1 Tax=uncultured Desulfosarcina sp. TaxID=218289 RepID=UPI0029C7D2C6|nr:hypothetical protein [uncultured Desulfosarcina sp.]